MQYSTKIDRTTETLNDVAMLVANIEEDRVLAAILNKRLSHDDVVEYTLRLREKRTRQQREIESLRKFSKTFNKEFATNHNKCFSTGQRLFGVIRSNMSETLKLLKKFCPRVTGQPYVADGEEQKASVMDHSMLSRAVPYSPVFFGMEGCDTCVKEFIDELLRFFKDVEEALMMCEDVLQEENIIRKDTARCLRLYEKCCEEVIKRSYEFLEYFGEEGFAKEDRMSAEMHKMPTLQDFVSGHFHMHNKNEFQIHVLHKAYSEGKANDLSDIETFLWPTDHSKAMSARGIVEHFDELNPRGRQVGNSGRYRLSGKHVAVFMKWCDVKDTKKEKYFVERYFNEAYHGVYDTIASSTVNTAKNKLLLDDTDEREIWDEIERIARKYCNLYE